LLRHFNDGAVNGISDRLTIALAWVRRKAATLLLFVPIVLIASALAGYGWWWRYVADGVRENVSAFQTAQRELGREVKWDAFGVEGFPYRVEATLTAPRLTAPDRGAAYDGERVVMEVQPLRLGRVGVSLEGQQHFFYAKEGRWIETYLRADKALIDLTSARSAQGASLEIKRLTGKAKVDDKDLNVIVEEMSGGLNVSDASESEPLPRVAFTARLKNVALQGNLDLPLGPSIAWIDIDAGAKFPADVPEASTTTLFAEWRRTGTPIEIRRFELEWGGISVAASGEFKLDSQSLPEGRFHLKLGNHARILELLAEAGYINKETQALANKALNVLAFMSGDEKRRVSVPLRIEKGEVYLGPARVATLTPPTAQAQLGPIDAIP
jgi:hypothetical protein